MAAIPAATPGPSTLTTYRDDGPVARIIASAARALRVAAAVLVLLAALPVVLAVAIEGGDASTGLAAAVVAWFVVVAALATGRPEAGRLAWIVPPVVRAAEYATLLWIGAIAGGSAKPAAFALVAVLAFRHYDLVYRMRHQGLTPPPWVGAVALGWEGRLIVAWALLAIGALPAAFFVAAAILAVVFAGDSVRGWLRFADEQRDDAGSYEDEEDEGQ